MPSSSQSYSASSRTRDGGPLWLRLLVGSDLAGRPTFRSLTPATIASLAWWRIGITPTARLRAARFRESIRDDRGATFSVQSARQST